MRLFRVKMSFTNGMGMVRQGQLFAVVNPETDLSMPHGLDWEKGKDYYQEVLPKLPSWVGKKGFDDFISLVPAK